MRPIWAMVRTSSNTWIPQEQSSKSKGSCLRIRKRDIAGPKARRTITSQAPHNRRNRNWPKATKLRSRRSISCRIVRRQQKKFLRFKLKNKRRSQLSRQLEPILRITPNQQKKVSGLPRIWARPRWIPSTRPKKKSISKMISNRQ